MFDGRKKFRYRKTTLRSGGRKETVSLHRQIMELHLGRKLSRFEVVHHKNEDTLDNKIENLEVMSLGEHTRLHCLGRLPSAVLTGANRHPGSSNWKAKLTEGQASAIKIAALAPGASRAEIAKRFGVSGSTVSGIKHGKRWTHVQ
jgi:hypothetical protein